MRHLRKDLKGFSHSYTDSPELKPPNVQHLLGRFHAFFGLPLTLTAVCSAFYLAEERFSLKPPTGSAGLVRRGRIKCGNQLKLPNGAHFRLLGLQRELLLSPGLLWHQSVWPSVCACVCVRICECVFGRGGGVHSGISCYRELESFSWRYQLMLNIVPVNSFFLFFFYSFLLIFGWFLLFLFPLFVTFNRLFSLTLFVSLYFVPILVYCISLIFCLCFLCLSLNCFFSFSLVFLFFWLSYFFSFG